MIEQANEWKNAREPTFDLARDLKGTERRAEPYPYYERPKREMVAQQPSFSFPLPSGKLIKDNYKQQALAKREQAEQARQAEQATEPVESPQTTTVLDRVFSAIGWVIFGVSDTPEPEPEPETPGIGFNPDKNLAIELIKRCDMQTIGRLCQTSQWWNKMCNHDNVWRYMWKTEYQEANADINKSLQTMEWFHTPSITPQAGTFWNELAQIRVDVPIQF
jgi:hypothetical protein